MSYKINVTTPIQTYSFVFGKRNLDYYVEIVGKDTKAIFGTKDFVNKSFEKFITAIGKKDEYSDYLTHFETIDAKKFSLSKVFVD